MLSPLFPPIPIDVGPGNPYSRDPGGSTNIHIYVGRRPGTSGGQQIYTFMWGPGPVHQEPREVRKYTQLCGARGPRSPGTPGGQRIYAIMWGPGAPYNKDPGRSTNICNYVWPGGPGHQGLRGPNNLHLPQNTPNQYTKSKTKPPRKSDMPA